MVFGDRTPLLGMLTVPVRGRGTRGVVVCAPFGHEGTRAYRPLRTLAERVARDGRPVLRFDWPGSGDSADADELDAATWTSAVGDALRALKESTGVEEVAIVGLRIGGTVAVLAALDEPSVTELVLLAPYATGGAYLDDVRAFEVASSHLYREPGHEVPAVPAGALEASGFLLSEPEVQALEALDLASVDAARSAVRRALVVAAEDDIPAREVARVLAGAVPDTTFEVRPELPQVWDGTNISVLPRECERIVRGWLRDGDPVARRRQQVPDRPLSVRLPVGEGVHEDAVVFDAARGRRFAVTCEPAEPVGADDAWVIFLNAGRVRRSGPNRLWTSYARTWARSGLPSLRLDVWGTGDSDGSPVLDELQVHLRSQFLTHVIGEDIDRALAWLSEHRGARRFALVGMCSTAYWSFRTALADPRVVSAALINLPTLYWDGRPTVLQSRAALRDIRLIGSTPRLWRHAARAGARPPLRELADGALERVGRKRLRSYRPNLPTAFETLSDRGTDTLVVFSEGDRGLGYLERNVGADFRVVLERYGVTTEIVRGPDHIFRPLWSHDVLRDLIEAQLRRVRFVQGEASLPSSGRAGVRRALG